jgi:ADP-heptose:LPS heptosyltransferase
MRHVLVTRLDSLGDMLVCGPAIRACAARADRVTVLAGPGGAEAARLLPGVDDVVEWTCPWIVADPPPVDPADVDDIVGRLATMEVDEAVILTSFHQSALPTALLLRLAGVPRITGISDDYPGSLLDVRLASPPDGPEPERVLAIARGAGAELPPGDDGRLALRGPLPEPVSVPGEPFVVLHPGVTAPARGYPIACWAEVAALLTGRGKTVLVTGSAPESRLTATVARAARRPGRAHDRAGHDNVAGLASILDRATVLVAGNTGPAHLAAAVGTPVVSLFAPVVPARRWAPYGVPTVVLGDQDAPCRGTRARLCPVEGHPCLSSVSPQAVVDSVDQLIGRAA